MKLFKIDNTPNGVMLSRDSMILVDQRDGKTVFLIRFPFAFTRTILDPNTFLPKRGPCHYTWVWMRRPNGNMIRFKGWLSA